MSCVICLEADETVESCSNEYENCLCKENLFHEKCWTTYDAYHSTCPICHASRRSGGDVVVVIPTDAIDQRRCDHSPCWCYLNYFFFGVVSFLMGSSMICGILSQTLTWETLFMLSIQCAFFAADVWSTVADRSSGRCFFYMHNCNPPCLHNLYAGIRIAYLIPMVFIVATQEELSLLLKCPLYVLTGEAMLALVTCAFSVILFTLAMIDRGCFYR